MSDRLRAAEYLLDEIGGIDDALLHDAMTVRRRSRAPKILLIAATLILSAALLVGVMAAAVAVPIGVLILDSIFDNVVSPPQNALPEETDGLEGLLLSKENAGYKTVKKENLPLDEGIAYLVWQYEGEDEYVVSEPLSSPELIRLEKNLGRGQRVGESSPSMRCRVWLIRPNGEVVTPYLENTSGNTGADVFDYDAEIYPSEEFVNDVSAILD